MLSASFPTRRIAGVAAFALSAVVAAQPQTADASAAPEVFSPVVHSNEFHTEGQFSRTFDDSDEKSGEEEFGVEAAYGVTDFWETEVLLEYKDAADAEAGDGELNFEATEWKNTLQVTDERDDSFMSFGLFAALAIPDEKGASDELEWGPLFQKKAFGLTHTANLLFTTPLNNTDGEDTSMEYKWQSKYKVTHYFQPALEVFGEPGETSDFKELDDQDTRAGLTILGHFHPGGIPGNFSYEVGGLAGLNEETPDATLKAIVGYGIHF